MGYTAVKLDELRPIDLDDVFTIKEFEEMVNTGEDAKRLYRKMMTDKKVCKIYIARRTCEDDETDPEMLVEYENDYILSQYKHEYYVAEIYFNDADYPDIADRLIFNNYNYERYVSFTFNIYCLHEKCADYRSCVVLKYWTPDRLRGRPHLADDLTHIAQYLKTLTNKAIEERQLKELESKEKRVAYEKINKKQNGIYDKMYKIGI
jgi:hypothetical protein